jgi:hypothetical protein
MKNNFRDPRPDRIGERLVAIGLARLFIRIASV